MRVVIVLLLLISVNLFAQKEKSNSDYSKMLIGVSFSPDYAYRTLSGDGSVISNFIIENRNNSEIPKFGYTAGLNFNYFFNKRIGIGSGILFSNKGYQLETGSLVFGDIRTLRNSFAPIDPNDPSIPENVKQVFNHYYIDIPTKILFNIGRGNVRFVTGLGIVTNLLVRSTTKNIITYKSGDTKKTNQSSTSSYHKLNFSPTISLGIEKQFKNKSIIRVEPTFNYGLIGIIDAPITANLWSAGLNISYYLRLK